MEDAGPSSGAMDNVPIQAVCQQPGANHRIGSKLLSQPSCPALVQSESPVAHDRPSKRRRVSTSHTPSVNKEQSQAAFMQQTPQLQPCAVDSPPRGGVGACKASGISKSSHGVAFGSPCLTRSTPSPLSDTQVSVGSDWRSSGDKGQENDGSEKRSSPKAVRCHGATSLAVFESNRATRKGLGWYGVLVQAHVHLCRAQNHAAAHLFNQVAAVFPAEIHTLLGAAAALLAAGDQVGALSTYQRARSVDSLNVRGMDAYARLLLELGSTKELQSLSQDMLGVDPELPEVWAVTACFWLQHNDWERALEAVSKCVCRRQLYVFQCAEISDAPQSMCNAECGVQRPEVQTRSCRTAPRKGALPSAQERLRGGSGGVPNGVAQLQRQCCIQWRSACMPHAPPFPRGSPACAHCTACTSG